MNHIVSIDAESNGLGGQAFAVALVLSGHPGTEDDYAVYRCPIDGPVDPWVAENVLPAIEDVPVNCADYWSLCDGVRDAMRRFVTEPDQEDRGYVICHILWPVEARLLLDVYPDPNRAPYPLIDVAAMLHQAGHDPTTVDEYLDAWMTLPVPDGSPHHPLYDARAAVTAYWNLREMPRDRP